MKAKKNPWIIGAEAGLATLSASALFDMAGYSFAGAISGSAARMLIFGLCVIAFQRLYSGLVDVAVIMSGRRLGSR
jgi:hypothetical protein